MKVCKTLQTLLVVLTVLSLSSNRGVDNIQIAILIFLVNLVTFRTFWYKGDSKIILDMLQLRLKYKSKKTLYQINTRALNRVYNIDIFKL